MAFPANFTRVWVRGRLVDLGKLATGESNFGIPKPITFTPSPQVLLNRGTNQIIQTNSFSVMPSGTDGYFAIELPATNDPDIVPVGWTYAVVEPTGRKYNIVVDFDTPPLDAPGDPLEGLPVLDLINIIPAPGSSAGTVQLVGGMVANLGDVFLGDLQGGSTLVYDSDTGLWKAMVLDLNDQESGFFRSGPTGSRGTPSQGAVFFDTTLGRPIIGDGAAWRDFDGNILGTGTGGGGSTTDTPMVETAKLLLARFQASQTVEEDWSYAGMPAVVTNNHDALLDVYQAEVPLSANYTQDPTKTIPWLQGFIARGGTVGGAGNAPQNLTATLDQTNRTITLNWTAVPGATHYKIYESRSPDGVSGADNITGTTSIRGPLTGNGTVYSYWVTAFVNGVETAQSNTAGGTLGGSGGGGGTPTGDTPGAILNIANGNNGKNHFNVGIGYSTGHVDKTPEQIANGFADAPYFTTARGNTVAQFQVYANGKTTSSGTKYPRSELREMEQNGTTRAAWNGASGTHWMEGKSRITRLPNGRSWVCFTQIHDAESDLARLQIEGTSSSDLKVVLRNTPPGSSSETTRTVMASYTLGTELTWRWEVVNGAGKLILNGTTWTFPASTSGCYFKTGAYAQFNSTQVSASEYVTVELRDLKHWHTGWPTPGDNGGGTSGGGSTGSYDPSSSSQSPVGLAPAVSGSINATGDQGDVTITAGGTSGNPRVYDYKGFRTGRITVKAPYVVVQNAYCRSGSQYGVVVDADDVTIRNVEISDLTPTGDGDMNALTIWGGRAKIINVRAENFIRSGVNIGGSHTDALQGWVSTSHPRSLSGLEVRGCRFVGPRKPSDGSRGYNISQCVMLESGGNGGNSGGTSGKITGLVIADNYFLDDWNQCLKFNDADGAIVTRNKFAGYSSKVIDLQGSTGTKFYSDNVVGSGYGSVGASITSGSGPA